MKTRDVRITYELRMYRMYNTLRTPVPRLVCCVVLGVNFLLLSLVVLKMAARNVDKNVDKTAEYVFIKVWCFSGLFNKWF